MAKRKYKRLHYEDRQTIEAMSKQGSSVKDIAEALGTHRDTIYREFKRCGARYEIRSGRRIRHGAGSNTYPDRRGSGSRRGRKRQNSPYTFQSGKSGLQGNCAGTHRHRGRNDNRRHCSTERSIKAV